MKVPLANSLVKSIYSFRSGIPCGTEMVGTPDLSEACLNYCTYGGDDTSHYNVNIGLLKSIVKHVILARGIAYRITNPVLAAELERVAMREISAELLPPDSQGKITQKTEEILGPYPIHDFMIEKFLGDGMDPTKIVLLAKIAFQPFFPQDLILKTGETLFQRFPGGQFKRHRAPDGLQLGKVAVDRYSLILPTEGSACTDAFKP